ncbi:MAG: HD domain-containing protein [SAR324 cluster bacterium]|nr:HD domain-containing protein [SAR324 cluster bacterium]
MGALQMQNRYLRVNTDDLKKNMRIRGISSFGTQFQSLDDQTCAWLKQNFSKAKAKAERSGAQLEIVIDELQQGDHLTKIFDFPKEFNRFDSMSEKLFRELKKRGFLSFDAEVIQPSNQNAARTEAVAAGKQLQVHLSTGNKLRDQLSGTLSETFRKIEQGSLDISDMQEMTKSVLKETSPEALTAIANLRESEQTYAHCIDVGAIFLDTYQKSNMAKNRAQFPDETQILLAGFLHDIGKAKVPKEIIESTKRYELDSPEMISIRNHPVYGAEILEQMGLPKTVVKMAGQHHIKLNSGLVSSYPAAANYDDVLPESRLLSIVDVYQALVGKRKYKKSWSPAEAIRYLDSLAGIEYDQDTFDTFLSVMGKWPIGTLVELSDKSKGFIIKQSTDLNSPQVVQVISANNERLTHTPILDLSVEKDITIVTDHHVDQVFEGEDGMELFASLELC